MKNKIIIPLLCSLTFFLCNKFALAQSSIPFTIKTRESTLQERKSWKLANKCDEKLSKMSPTQTEECFKQACDKGEAKGCSRYALLLQEKKALPLKH